MIVVDVETSGVDFRKNAIVSIGAVDFRNPTNRFYGECRIFDGAEITEESLGVNGFTREELHDPKKMTSDELITSFALWASQISEKTFAGQNTSFDRDFLAAAAARAHIAWPFSYRTIDLHSIAYAHYMKRGSSEMMDAKGLSQLSLDAILVYVGLPAEPKPHKALAGALHEAEAFSRLIVKKNLLPEFAGYPLSAECFS